MREIETIRTLTLAADGSEAQLDAAVARVGPRRTAEILVDELVSRADLDELETPIGRTVLVQLNLTNGEPLPCYVRKFGPAIEHGLVTADARLRTPDITVDVDLKQLVRGVFGPRRASGLADGGIHWDDVHDQETFGWRCEHLPFVHRLLRGALPYQEDLAQLSLRNRTNKWGTHYYAGHYERHFAPFRDRPLTVLELGIGGYGSSATGGGSLRMWKRYFRRALIFGADLFDKSAVAEQRIYPLQGDLSDRAFLASLADRTGALDIVIDDASHRCADVILAFQELFARLNDGGLYVIEDLETSYWEGYGGNSDDLNDPATSVGFLKTLVDGLYETGHSVAGVHFYHNLAVIQKGQVAERPLPIRVRQAPSYEDMAAVGLSAAPAVEPA